MKISAAPYLTEDGRNCCRHVANGIPIVARIQTPIDYMMGAKVLACQECVEQMEKIEKEENEENPGQIYWRVIRDDKP